MECNRDEALRAKEIAEKNLLEGDILGAKKFALKAQNLFPKLEGLSQFLEIIDVYISYENKKNGEGTCGVDPFVEEEVLKKQYRRTALSFHPDKNKSVEADGAFKILSEALTVMSNKDNRSAYSLKPNISASSQGGNFSSSSAQFTATATNSQNVPTRPQAPRTATGQQHTTIGICGQRAPLFETFWTSCSGCAVQFEYKKIFLNQNLLCHNCKKPFSAIELPVPIVNGRQQYMPAFPNGPRSVPNLVKRTSGAASSRKGHKRRSSNVPKKVETAAQSTRSEIRRMLQETAKTEIGFYHCYWIGTNHYR